MGSKILVYDTGTCSYVRTFSLLFSLLTSFVARQARSACKGMVELEKAKWAAQCEAILPSAGPTSRFTYIWDHKGPSTRKQRGLGTTDHPEDVARAHATTASSKRGDQLLQKQCTHSHEIGQFLPPFYPNITPVLHHFYPIFAPVNGKIPSFYPVFTPVPLVSFTPILTWG